MMKDKIEMLRAELAALIGDWERDHSSPPNYVRKTGLGDVVAIVDVWCGGYQSPHNPVTVGWKCEHRVTVGALNTAHKQSTRGFVIVADYADKDAAIEGAKKQADHALIVLSGRG